ncbi:hypothetical protein [Halomonas salifodinae]|uniref:hypothetical protein n=1 Tax=Halomonas salifodinae TaxID=438745 RepID=UPI0033B93237
MASSSIARRLLTALRQRLTRRRHYAELRDYDPRLLRDIGLRWEQGHLVAFNAESEREPESARRRRRAETRDAHETCPRCGRRLT